MVGLADSISETVSVSGVVVSRSTGAIMGVLAGRFRLVAGLLVPSVEQSPKASVAEL